MITLCGYVLDISRWWVFGAVGTAGLGVQLACLWILKDGFGMHYVVAASIAVELAILHNFFCHVRWTWRDRPAPSAILVPRLACFHLTSGMIAVISLVLMTWLVEIVRMNYLLATLMSVAACGVVNFALDDRAIFRKVGTVSRGHGSEQSSVRPG